MSPGRVSQDRGHCWETRAAEFLSTQGLCILTRGYRCRLGELDIIASDGASLVIVEVRARSRTHKGSAIATIGPRKRRRIVNATRHYLMKHPAWFSKPIRFDVVAIDEIETSEPVLNWIPNAFDAT